MSALAPHLSVPRCSACFRRATRSGLVSLLAGPSLVQIRGKSNNPKASSTINVRLLQDLKGYGRAGSIVPVPIGRMRNLYFPRRVADYIPQSEARQLKRANIIPHRDTAFGRESQKEIEEAAKAIEKATLRSPTRQPVRVDLDLLQPEEAFTVLANILPPKIAFFRAPIEPSVKTPKERASASTATSVSAENPDQKDIYGSVSISDIGNNLRALLKESDVGGRVVLADEDIRFVSRTEEGETMDRAKRLGEYDIEIRLKGHDGAFSRKVNVLPEEAEITLDAAAATVPGVMGEEQALAEAEAEAREEAALRAPKTGGQMLPDQKEVTAEPIRARNISP